MNSSQPCMGVPGLDGSGGSSSQASFCLCSSSSTEALSVFLLPCAPALLVVLKLFHICWRCASHKKDVTHWSGFFRLPRFPPSVGETFSVEQTTKPMLQCLYFPTVVSLGASLGTSTSYSGALCQDSRRRVAAKPPSPVCLHPLLSQQLSVTAFPGLTYFSAPILSPPSLSPPRRPSPPFSQQQQPLSPCQPGASASVQLLTEVTGVTYNYMVMDYGALFSNQIFAFLQVAE